MKKVRIWFLVVFLVWAAGPILGLPTDSSSKTPFSKESKEGYTIWGLSPGDDLARVLQALPSSVEVERVEAVGSERTTTIKDAKGRCLTLVSETQSGSDIIQRIGVFPVTSLFTIEHSGLPVIFSTDGPERVQAVLGTKTEDGTTDIYVFERFKIHLTFLNGRLLSAGMSLRQ